MPSKPFMQLYVGDFLADTQALTMTELGVYFTLLLNQWSTGGALPADRLHLLCRMTRNKFQKISPQIEPFFLKDSAGNWYNKRVEKELIDFHVKAAERSGKARRAASARWGGEFDE